VATWCTNSLTFNNCTFCSRCVYVFCIYLRTNSDLCHLHHKLIGFYNRDGKCLHRGTDWGLNEAICACATYSINWLVFITGMESVYSAVRTGALNEAVCACATSLVGPNIFIRIFLSNTESLCIIISVRTLVTIMFINSKWVDTRWQWSVYILRMHGLWRLITLDLIWEGYMGSI
jgi:hypothetical protein